MLHQFNCSLMKSRRSSRWNKILLFKGNVFEKLCLPLLYASLFTKLRHFLFFLGNLGNNRRRHQNRSNQVVPSSNSDANEPIHTIPCPSDPPRRVPALAPPTRRRMISDVELANALSILQQQQQRAGGRRPLPQYRRRRRSTVLHRPKTPALSPIHESGLSNPASPSRTTVAAVSGSCARPY